MRRDVLGGLAAIVVAAATNDGRVHVASDTVRFASDAAYVRAWADAGHPLRAGGAFHMGGALHMFGPIDVGCRVEIDQLGLSEHGRTPTISWVFADGRRLRVDPLNAEKESAHFAARPALCEYVPVGPPRNASGEVALLMVANSPTYLFRLWLLFLNKLLFATDAGLRPFLWVGELPAAARHPTNPACLESREVWCKHNSASCPGYSRRLHSAQSFYDGANIKLFHADVSNHYIKMPATLATLAAPSVGGLYYEDLDTVVHWPWRGHLPLKLAEHRNVGRDIAFPSKDDAETGRTQWRVKGSKYYVRDTPAGRAFFARWFANRCTFKDQYSLWHTILELADEAKCLTYDGSIYRDFTYTGARGSNWDGSARDEFGPDAQKRKGSRPGTKLPLLSCAQMQETCPGWTFDDCTRKSSRLVEKVFVHDSIYQANGTTTYSFDRGELVVEMPAFTLGSEPGPGRRPVSTTYPTYTHRGHTFIVYDHAALEGKLGISDRDRERHPWGEP